MYQFRSISLQIPKLWRWSFLVFYIAAVFQAASGQTTGSHAKNNPFSPSPVRKPKEPAPIPTPTQAGSREVSFAMQSSQAPPRTDLSADIVRTTFDIAKRAGPATILPTDIYKIGIGDVLYIDLKNVQQGSGYYTVRPDGTIDFPLAGENVIVAGQTIDGVKEFLAAGIAIFKDSQVEVKVREYASHKITVSGMVERPGEKAMQREAMPFFTIRAEAGVDARATKALIARGAEQNRETYSLSDAKTDNILIYPGNTIEFTSDTGKLGLPGGQYYFVSGEVVAAGQRELTDGLTLYQAVIAAGGPKGDPKKAILRRKNNGGVFVLFEHNLRAIRGGKAQDPSLAPGDVIEVRN